ncbi:Di-copper centre-containing protein [Fusarium austroafricanum]|uniref:tyrosinase n=1 Tax=Fusarium austroafricanum TaxID=2364996 RepID=A0A8H4P6A3_9HYPO|nr:Di-copper centre-containing protein [Fusarium austroafricanum]
MGSDTTNYAITGIQDGLSPDRKNPLREVPVRLEIDDWFTSDDPIHINQRALFFPAFNRFAGANPHEALSWYQIAGIHGQPYVGWPVEPPAKGETSNRGYCTHNSILFTTWHRPYMLLWEQVIYNLMRDEVNRYPQDDQAALLKALESWRFPYWDWAMKKARDPNNENDLNYDIPLVMNDTEVEIRLPPPQMTGKVRNAFHHFSMPGNITMGDKSLESQDEDDNLRKLKDLSVHAMDINDQDLGKIQLVFNQCQGTSRHLTDDDVKAKTWVEGQQNNDGIVDSLRDQVEFPGDNDKGNPKRKGNVTASLREAFYRLLTITKFEDFATKRTIIDPNTKRPMKPLPNDSAEGLHDSIHDWCGGQTVQVGDKQTWLVGHMGIPALAAFDPIFWLHHCNIDRLFAMWQILHDKHDEESWFSGKDTRDKDAGTFGIPPNNTDTPDYPLKPFLKSAESNDFYTSNDIRECSSLGYTYPGLEKWNYVKLDGSYDRERHIQDVNILLNNSYGAGRRAWQKAKLTADPGQPGIQLNSITRDSAPDGDLIGQPDYIVDIVYEKFALGGLPYSIHVFVGKPGEVPYLFNAADPPVGEIVSFSGPKELEGTDGGCGNCRSQAEDHTKSSGRIVLTNALITRWKNKIQHTPNDPNGPRVLESMKPKDVVKFLKHNLHWRVTSLGQEVELDKLPSLKIALAVGKADHFVDKTKLSKYYGYKGAHEVTQGRPGGAGPEDGLYPPGYEWQPEE